MRRLLPAVVAVAAVAALGGCGGSSGSTSKPGATVPPGAVVVDIKNIAFNPKTVTVQAGQTVAWTFDDGIIVHNVTGDGYHSGDHSKGVYTHTFTSAGDYKYRCTIHSGMDGEVVVK